MKLQLQNKFKSLDPFSIDLPNFVILTGINGAGKTQLLTAIDQNILKVYDNNTIRVTFLRLIFIKRKHKFY